MPDNVIPMRRPDAPPAWQALLAEIRALAFVIAENRSKKYEDAIEYLRANL